MYELKDILWDEFGGSDDHIVPHPGSEQVDDCAAQGVCHMKPLREDLTSVGNSAVSRSVVKDVIKGKEGTRFPTLKDTKSPMLEKGSWSCAPDGVFPNSSDIGRLKEVTSIASEDAKISSNCFKRSDVDSIGNDFCEDAVIYGNGGAAIDINFCRFPSDISPTDSDLEFFGNEHEDKESGDLLYYGWPDIGNFEDVDRMFRSCDSTFGQGNATNDDELSWFSSSSCAINGSEDALKSGFKSSCAELSALRTTSKHHEADMKFMPDNVTPLITDSGKKNVHNTYTTSPRKLDAGESATLRHMSYGNWLDINAENKREFVSKEQAHINRGVEVKKSPGTQTSKESSVMVNLQRKHSKLHNQSEGKRKDRSSEYLSGGSYRGPGTMQQSPMERSSNPSLKAPAMTPEENIEKLRWQQQMEATLTVDSQHEDLVGLAAFTDQVAVQKKLHQAQDEVGGHSELDGVGTELPAVEVDSSTVQEGSCLSSVLSGEISLEAASFRQLQYIMKQLDIRTKLCLRDSLYRLARSAEQRHNFGNSNSSLRDCRDKTGVTTTEESNKCTGFMDMETDTNPIDRSIAHLLFHQPANPSTRPANDALSLESRTMIHGSLTSQQVIPGKLVCQEEVAGGAGIQLLLTDQQ